MHNGERYWILNLVFRGWFLLITSNAAFHDTIFSQDDATADLQVPSPSNPPPAINIDATDQLPITPLVPPNPLDANNTPTSSPLYATSINPSNSPRSSPTPPLTDTDLANADSLSSHSSSLGGRNIDDRIERQKRKRDERAKARIGKKRKLAQKYVVNYIKGDHVTNSIGYHQAITYNKITNSYAKHYTRNF